MKKAISILLAAVLMIPSTAVFAEEVTETERMTFTLDEAIEYAKTHSPKVEKVNADVKKSKYEVTNARRTYNNYESYGSSFDEALLDSGYVYEATQIQEKQTNRNANDEINSLETSVKKSFYTCINSKNKISAAAENIENSKKKLEHAKVKYEQGTISKLDLKNFELAETNATNAYNKTLRDADLAQKELKNILNINDAVELTLIGEFNPVELSYATDTEAKELVKNQNSYLSIQEARQLAEKRMRCAEAWYASTEIGYYIECSNYKSTLANLSDSEDALEYGITELYYGILTLKETVDYLKESVELLREGTEASYLQYELGMITSSEYIEKEQQYFEARNSMIDTEITYYITVLEYVNMYSGNSDI